MIYEFDCLKCGKEFEVNCPLSERTAKHKCPTCKSVRVEQALRTAVPIGDPMRLGRMKVPSGFNEVMKQIKKKNPGSTIPIY